MVYFVTRLQSLSPMLGLALTREHSGLPRPNVPTLVYIPWYVIYVETSTIGTEGRALASSFLRPTRVLFTIERRFGVVELCSSERNVDNVQFDYLLGYE